MVNFEGFASTEIAAPAPADPQAARVGLERWRDAIDRLNDESASARADAVMARKDVTRLLAGVVSYSPYLLSLCEREPLFLCDMLEDGPDAARRQVMVSVQAAAAEAIGGADPSRPLRVAKRQLALTTALADIAGVWPLEVVTAALSEFAEAAIGCAADYLLVEAARAGAFVLAHPDEPQRDSGLIVLGMGKLGARELNYSSDVDLIVFYDEDRIVTNDPDRLQHRFVRLTRGLVRILEERTKDGYVFRTDLRLRPDPGSMPPAVSVLAAETYYETLGQNWERAALIKARPVAGDREAAAQLLRNLQPYIWRKNLDFAAIQDIHSIKRQINAHRGGGKVTMLGHNIKLGRGGIREIEFYAQTQQLIWGGRVPSLRCITTVDALRQLAHLGKIRLDASDAMIEAYAFLRRVEHRLQMINDEQTHVLPKSRDGLHAFAGFLGYPHAEAFEAELLARLRAVESLYGHLFEDAPALSAQDAIGGNLVFTGADADPETLRTLEALGFSNAKAVDAAVRGWHHGRYRAMRSARARELLTELMPILLKVLADTADADASLIAFDRFLSGLPAGLQLFSMFHSKPQLLALVAEVMGGSPRLAHHLARNPHLLEGVLMADLFAPPPTPAELTSELDEALVQARDLEDALDLVRRWTNDRKFQAGIQTLRRLIDAPEAALALSNVAEVSLRALYPRVERDFVSRHGRIAGCEMAIVAMGKLGGREMTPTSDLDLIFVYTTPAEGAESDGEHPLPASQYFARLSQRFIAAVTAPTAEGILYEIDMRLRPSGKAGPIAVSFDTFARYQRHEAWTWEQMALTRGRPVCGPTGLVRDLERVIHEVLTQQRDGGKLVVDVADMRARMDAEHHTDSIWEVKHVRGGQVDIEFISQYLQLLHAHDHPDVLSTNTMTALRACREVGVIDLEVAHVLLDALALWQTVQQRVRLMVGDSSGAAGGDDAPEALRRAVKDIDGLEFPQLLDRMRATAEDVHGAFQTLIAEPAAALAQDAAAP